MGHINRSGHGQPSCSSPQWSPQFLSVHTAVDLPLNYLLTMLRYSAILDDGAHHLHKTIMFEGNISLYLTNSTSIRVPLVGISLSTINHTSLPRKLEKMNKLAAHHGGAHEHITMQRQNGRKTKGTVVVMLSQRGSKV